MKRISISILAIFLFLTGITYAASPQFEPDMTLFEFFKSELLREHQVSDVQNWRGVLVFRCWGKFREGLFAKQREFNNRIKVTIEEATYQETDVYLLKFFVIDTNKVTETAISKKNLNFVYRKTTDILQGKRFEQMITVIGKKIKCVTSAEGEIVEQKEVKMGKEIKDIYESEALPLVLVTFPFAPNASYETNVHFNFAYTIFPIRIDYQGRETISVPYGTFNSHKIRINPTGVLAPFSRNYVWYRETSPHYLLKAHRHIWIFLDETWELLSIGKEKKN